jgi:hypothetical protein
MDSLEIGAKIQFIYSEIYRYYLSVMQDNPDCLEESNEDYEYVILCDLLMDKIKEEFPFVRVPD